MEQFKKMTIEDRDILAKYLGMQKHRACDYSVGNLILWSNVYDTQFAIKQDMLFIKFIKGEDHYFAYPIGNGDLKQAFEWLFAYCEEQNIEFKMNLIEPSMYEEIKKIYPDEYEISYIRDNADYVYSVEDLKNLAGKMYHGKKNHTNKFLKTNEDWAYETITEENTEECIEMVLEWGKENGCFEDKSKADEICVLIKGLKARKELDMTGGIIRAGGRIVALTMGEESDEDMFIIHFEKAFADVNGAYPMINQQFIIHELSNYTYVNREEDMGIKGLRKAKESYHPVFMAEKGILVRK
ncbi:MAG: phosphatidylglycerol lysyltransferase domain-containing protein [Anaerocolumna sp.]